MNLSIIEFSFKSEYHDEKSIEGAFFFDNDIISEEYARKIINNYGCDLNNNVFKKDAPCFFLPKAQADILRYNWVANKLRNVEQKIVSTLTEMQGESMTSNKCIDVIQNIFKQNILVKEEERSDYER